MRTLTLFFNMETMIRVARFRYALFLLFFALLSDVSFAQAPPSIWQIVDGNIIRWAYSGGDEFNGTSLDRNIWHCVPYRNNVENKELQYYTVKDNLDVSNGTLKIITKQDGVDSLVVPYEDPTVVLEDGLPNLRHFDYTSARIETNQMYLGGLFEISFKPPVGRGLWPAYWGYGANPNEELDVFEYKGETPNKIHWNVHCPSGCTDIGQWVTATGNFSDGFNDMMGELDNVDAIWYLNNVPFASWLGSLHFQENLILNMAVASDNGAFGPGPDNTTPFPATYEIDFVRFWTRLDCEQIMTVCNYHQTLTDPSVLTGQQIQMGGGTSCFPILENGQFLNLIATDNVTLEPGFVARNGSTFHAQIIGCPGPVQARSKPPGPLTIKNDDKTSPIVDPSSKKASLYTKIFPNPTAGKVTIEFVGQISMNISIELINSVGQIVFAKSDINEPLFDIDISNLPKGVYTLKGLFGEKVITDKLVLQ